MIKNELLYTFRLFPGGRVPYTIDADFTESERLVIASSISDIEFDSCVRWDSRAGNEQPYVRIKKDEDGCFASVGARTDGLINLGNGCVVSDFARLQCDAMVWL